MQNFPHFDKKDQLHRLNISDVIEFEKCGYLILESSCFRTPFESQRVHVSQTLPKSARQHFYPIFH